MYLDRYFTRSEIMRMPFYVWSTYGELGALKNQSGPELTFTLRSIIELVGASLGLLMLAETMPVDAWHPVAVAFARDCEQHALAHAEPSQELEGCSRYALLAAQDHTKESAMHAAKAAAYAAYALTPQGSVIGQPTFIVERARQKETLISLLERIPLCPQLIDSLR